MCSHPAVLIGEPRVEYMTRDCALRWAAAAAAPPAAHQTGLDGKEKPEANAEDAACRSTAAASNLPENERGKFMSHVTIETNMISHRVADVYNNYFAEMRDLVNVVRGRRGLHVHRVTLHAARLDGPEAAALTYRQEMGELLALISEREQQELSAQMALEEPAVVAAARRLISDALLQLQQTIITDLNRLMGFGGTFISAPTGCSTTGLGSAKLIRAIITGAPSRATTSGHPPDAAAAASHVASRVGLLPPAPPAIPFGHSYRPPGEPNLPSPAHTHRTAIILIA